jgi:hypothetical protein
MLLASFITHFFSLQAFVFLSLIQLMLMITHMVLGTLACIYCFCECFCRMKKLSRGLKKIFSPGTSHHGSDSHSLSDGMSLDSWQFLSSMPPQHEATPLGHYPVHVEMPPIDDDDISICSHEEMARFKTLCLREFAPTHVYDVSLLEHVGLDIKLPTIIRSIGWGKLYDEPRSGSCILTLKFLMTFEIYEHDGNLWVHFLLFGETNQVGFPHFSELLDFTRNCLPKSQAMRNFNCLDFCNDISGKTTRIRFIDIQNPSLRFLHRWLSFTLFPTWELCSVTVAELKCLFAMVHRIKYTPVVNIVDYFKEIHTLSGPIECTSLVTCIALNIGCPEMHNVAYIEGDVPIIGLSHFVHAHVLHEEPDHFISMLYEGGNKVLRLPNQAYLLRSCDQLIVQLNTLANARCSVSGPPHTCGCARWEVAGQTPS